jgi:hypothetical protein
MFIAILDGHFNEMKSFQGNDRKGLVDTISHILKNEYLKEQYEKKKLLKKKLTRKQTEG